jgi:hypothetical protein
LDFEIAASFELRAMRKKQLASGFWLLDSIIVNYSDYYTKRDKRYIRKIYQQLKASSQKL